MRSLQNLSFVLTVRHYLYYLGYAVNSFGRSHRGLMWGILVAFFLNRQCGVALPAFAWYSQATMMLFITLAVVAVIDQLHVMLTILLYCALSESESVGRWYKKSWVEPIGALDLWFALAGKLRQETLRKEELAAQAVVSFVTRINRVCELWRKEGLRPLMPRALYHAEKGIPAKVDVENVPPEWQQTLLQLEEELPRARMLKPDFDSAVKLGIAKEFLRHVYAGNSEQACHMAGNAARFAQLMLEAQSTDVAVPASVESNRDSEELNRLIQHQKMILSRQALISNLYARVQAEINREPARCHLFDQLDRAQAAISTKEHDFRRLIHPVERALNTSL